MVIKIADISNNLFFQLDDQQSMVVSGGGVADGFLNNLIDPNLASLVALASQGKQIIT